MLLSTGQSLLKTCKFQCKACKFKWKGYRFEPAKDVTGKTIYNRKKGPGMTVCPKCKHEVIDWVNYEDFAVWYRKNIGDGGCGGEPRRKG